MIDARTQAERILRPFLPRIAQVAENRDGFEILLDVHAALARHCAEGAWLSIEDVGEQDVVTDILEDRLRGDLKIVAELHAEIGLVDEKLNQIIFGWLREIFYGRVEELAQMTRGRA